MDYINHFADLVGSYLHPGETVGAVAPRALSWPYAHFAAMPQPAKHSNTTHTSPPNVVLRSRVSRFLMSIETLLSRGPQRLCVIQAPESYNKQKVVLPNPKVANQHEPD